MMTSCGSAPSSVAISSRRIGAAAEPPQPLRLRLRRLLRRLHLLLRVYDVTYSDASRFSFFVPNQPILARRSPLAPAAHALAGLADGAGLLPMDPAEVPGQSEWR